MQIVVVGTGYVGLVSGTCFAACGHTVRCIDIDEKKVASLNSGHIPIYEPGLAEMVADGVEAGKLSFGTDLGSSIPDADFVFIAVGTPARAIDGYSDLTYLRAATDEIARHLTGRTLIVVKSTVPVGTCDEIEDRIRAVKPAADFDVAFNPEFMREGTAISDFLNPDRVILGGDREHVLGPLHQLYRATVPRDVPVQMVNRRTAELIKYTANAFLAMKVTFINEIAELCEKLDADVVDVAKGIGLDTRIGNKFLEAGPGFGGSCFPKDTNALVRLAQDAESPLRLIETTIDVNEIRKRQMAGKVIAMCGGDVRGKTIGLLGLTFKPNTDDMRESPALPIALALMDAGASVRAHDPEGVREAQRLMPDVEFADDPYALAHGCDAVVLVTHWQSFKDIDLGRLGALMAEKVLLDLRGVFAPEDLAEAGFASYSVGRPATSQRRAPAGAEAEPPADIVTPLTKRIKRSA
ncbi:UDP-glucose dehydrogenase family protein [Oricola cellulosilytica]|uniref:UDP-glucose 6-dehydrogenase n=1 Tax=Oricola cellulosilytica TaxID=1429082 RepID=A0A4R0P8Y3_9HYPH|nr:UDP-glucose/GDP-mannose dehydrogenase family protein [Oricola cellulosilytica]TCD12456.1 UDP-glucose/GDP-mannose dehydrogenase family protein [Oricola cellulosilytica]